MTERIKQKKDSQEITWYKLKYQDVLNMLGTNVLGLSLNEADKRLQKNGLNELPTESPMPLLKIFLSQIKSPLVYVLLAAAVISLIVGEFVDVVVILIAVLLNSIVGFWQEHKADRTILKLKSLVEYHSTVFREGREQRIPVNQIVEGDIMLLESGDKISADCRLIEVNNFQVNEASLTGESFPVDKITDQIKRDVTIGDRRNMVFLGTTVARGKAKAIVVSTGINTQIGQIATLVKDTKDEKTPLQKQLIAVSRLLTIIVIVAAIIVFVIGLWRGIHLEELFITSAALAVAAIPEGLLVAMTLVLVIGMQRILRKRALVRKLIAAETLGSVSIVCADKTGTITLGQMQVDSFIVGGETHKIEESIAIYKDGNEDHQHILAIKAVALCNNAYIKNPQDKLKEWDVVGDTTDVALLLAAEQVGFHKSDLNRDHGRIDEIPFHETYKFMATMHRAQNGETQIFVKGAPENVMNMCSRYLHKSRRVQIDKKQRKVFENEYFNLTKQGLRVLAIAFDTHTKSVTKFDDLMKGRDNPQLKDLVFIGWVGLKDPIRPEVPDAFKTLQNAGIRTVIVTGDHKFTAQAIVRELGMQVPDQRIVVGVDLNDMSDDELVARIEDIDIFARVEPKHKLRIVQAWKKKGEVVAMLGDGVNDAPALKAADIGIAVGSATDVAKETSDMLLLDSNFAVIESAIREGRVIFANIRKIFTYLMADSFTEIVLISLALIIGYPLPLAAVHILWINIMSDGLPNLALTMEPGEDNVMDYPPRDKNEPIVNKEVKIIIVAISTVAVTIVFGLYLYFFNKTGDITYTRSLVFSALAIHSIIYVFSVRSLRRPIWKLKFWSNKWLLGAAFIAVLSQIFIVYLPIFQKYLKTVPLGLNEWGLIFSLGACEIIAIEIIKGLYWRKQKKLVLT